MAQEATPSFRVFSWSRGTRRACGRRAPTEPPFAERRSALSGTSTAVTIWSRIARLIGATQEDRLPRPRLSAEDAIAIAREAAKDNAAWAQLTMVNLGERDGRLIWTVRQPVTGSSLEIDIDDSTGAVVHMGTRGFR